MRSLVILFLLLLAAPAQADEFSNVLLHSAATATGNGNVVTVNSFSTISVEVTISGVATLTWENSITGNVWSGATCLPANSVTGIPVTAATVSGLYHCNIATLTKFRARISTYVSGSVTAFARMTNIPFNTIATGGGSGGSDAIVTVTSITNPVAVTGAFYQATQPVSGSFYQATQPVSGTFWQATQPVSGPLTDVQLRATPVPISGTFWQATQPVSGTFWQATQPVSGTFFQATQPISAVSLPLPTGAALDTSVDGLEALVGTTNTNTSNTSAGVGATADAVATVGSTGSLNAKLRLITSQLDALLTELLQKTEPANTQIVGDGSGPLTVDGTVTTTPPSNASTNVAQFGGTNVVTGTGTGGAGIPRVTVSNDSTVTANAGTNLNTSALALDTSVDGLEGGVGASADAAATVASAGSLSAKLRLMTSQLDAIQNKDFATSAKQDTGNTSLGTIAGKDFSTSAKQDTGNTSLASIDAKVPAKLLSTIPVTVMLSAVPLPPVLPASANRLQYAMMMQRYCQQTLCPPLPGGFR